MLRSAFEVAVLLRKARRAFVLAFSEISDPGGLFLFGVKWERMFPYQPLSSFSLRLKNLAISLIRPDVWPPFKRRSERGLNCESNSEQLAGLSRRWRELAEQLLTPTLTWALIHRACFLSF